MPGSTVRLSSDQADTPVLSAPIVCSSSTVDIPTYRPLRAGETVTAKVAGCGAGPGSTASRSVDAVPALNPPQVHNPTRIWQTLAQVDKCVPGARVHLFVGDVWRGAADAADETAWVPCGALKPEDQLTAVQTLCSAVSSRSQEAVTATFGKMKVTVQPSPITKSANPQPVTVVVRDADDGHPVSGTVSMPGGVNQPTNVQFAWTFPPGQPGPAAKVHATDYEDAGVDWPLQEPPQPQPALMTLDFANNNPGVTVSKVEWQVTTRDANGVDVDMGHPTGSTAQVALPKPPGGSSQLYCVQCSVTVGSTVVKVVNGLCPDGSGRASIGWDGNPLTAHFRLYGTIVYDEKAKKYVPVYWVTYTGVS